MFRSLLLAVLCLPQVLLAQTLAVPGLSPDGAPQAALPDCIGAPYDQSNCVRVLACVGDAGLWFDGQAHGWDAGTVLGVVSDGTACAGTWNSQGFLGTGHSRMECADDTTVEVIYHTRDNETGTVIGTGRDSTGRAIRVWTGLYVLDFLAGADGAEPELPCGPTSIAVS